MCSDYFTIAYLVRLISFIRCRLGRLICTTSGDFSLEVGFYMLFKSWWSERALNSSSKLKLLIELSSSGSTSPIAGGLTYVTDGESDSFSSASFFYFLWYLKYELTGEGVSEASLRSGLSSNYKIYETAFDGRFMALGFVLSSLWVSMMFESLRWSLPYFFSSPPPSIVAASIISWVRMWVSVVLLRALGLVCKTVLLILRASTFYVYFLLSPPSSRRRAVCAYWACWLDVYLPPDLLGGL